MIGALLGHTNPATTARYAHLMADPLKQAAEAIGSRLAGDERAAK
jgi:site-specific recombinase XerD